MTPQELMDLPFAGMAEKELRKCGEWDDTKIIDGVNDYEFVIKVNGWYEPEVEHQRYTVIAKSVDEAYDMAEDLSDFDNIDDCEVVSVKEAQQ